MPLNGRHILLGVTGGIAAYKAADLASQLGKRRATVTAVMTRAAQEFITPLTLQTLTHRPVVTTLFDPATPEAIEHIALARAADLVVIAPCTANVLAKLAHGIADDPLTTICLATEAPLLLAPAMNVTMWEHAATRENVATLQKRSVGFVEPDAGLLACGEEGPGRLAAVDTILEHIERALGVRRDLAGLQIVVTAGPTREPIDPIRFVSNRSTGKMGYALAEAAAARGADVTLVSGPTHLNAPAGVRTERVETAAEMADQVFAAMENGDVFIGAAAVSDFTPRATAEKKIKKAQAVPTLELERTTDILATLAAQGRGRTYVGFSMETDDVERHAQEKLQRKQLDLVVANDVTQPGAGFAHDTNAVVLYDRTGRTEHISLRHKRAVADAVLDAVVRLRNGHSNGGAARA